MIVIPKKENKDAYTLFNNDNNKNSIKFLDLNMNKIQWNIGHFHEVTQILKSFNQCDSLKPSSKQKILFRLNAEFV